MGSADVGGGRTTAIRAPARGARVIEEVRAQLVASDASGGRAIDGNSHLGRDTALTVQQLRNCLLFDASGLRKRRLATAEPYSFCDQWVLVAIVHAPGKYTLWCRAVNPQWFSTS
jgi:hypothetical protein